MARDQYGVANSFANAFMQGFSFVDDISRRKRAEARLEEELERNRARQDTMDARQSTLFRQSQQDRGTRLSNEQRLKEVSELLADPNVSDAELQQYADIPEVSAFMAQRRNDAQLREDAGIVFGSQGGGGGGAPQGAPGNQATQQPGGLVSQVEAAAMPGNAPRPTITQAEIQELSFTDPDQAKEIRDQQATERATEQEDRLQISEAQKQARAAGLSPGERAPTERELEAQKKASQDNEVTRDWRQFADVTAPGHDQMTSLPSGTLVNQYHQNRNRITDAQVRSDADRRMRPHIQETIQSARETLATPGLETDSLDARRATRQLQNAMGLAQELNVSYQPLREGGVDGRGLPVNGNNRALTENVLNASLAGPGTPMPSSPAQTRADMTVVNRGVRGGRLSERQAQSAFRLFKGGMLPLESYQTYLRTGRLPSNKPEVKFEQFDPEKAVYADYGDGVLRMVMPPRELSDAALERGRNLFSDEGLTQMNKWASAFDTSDNRQGGTQMIQAFTEAVAFNEQAIAGRGMRLQNVNDVSRLWRYWTDIHAIRDAYNDEWFVDGRVNPDFNQVYGSMEKVFLDPRFNDEFINDRNLRAPGTTTFGLGGQAPQTADLPQRPPGFYDNARQTFPEFANSNDEEIDAAFTAVGR